LSASAERQPHACRNPKQTNKFNHLSEGLGFSATLMRKGNFERVPTRAIREAVYKTADVYCHLCMSFHNYPNNSKACARIIRRRRKPRKPRARNGPATAR
jgi:hypothetical protein